MLLKYLENSAHYKNFFRNFDTNGQNKWKKKTKLLFIHAKQLAFNILNPQLKQSLH